MDDEEDQELEYAYRFKGERTPDGLAIHKGLRLGTKQTFYQSPKSKNRSQEKYWRQLELKSKKFYQVRKQQRENRFKKLIQQKLQSAIPMMNGMELQDANSTNSLLKKFNKLTLKRSNTTTTTATATTTTTSNTTTKDTDILIVDPRMIEKLDNKSKIIPIHQDLKPLPYQKLNEKSLDVKKLSSSYVFKSLNNLNQKQMQNQKQKQKQKQNQNQKQNNNNNNNKAKFNNLTSSKTTLKKSSQSLFDTKDLTSYLTQSRINSMNFGKKTMNILRASSLPVLVKRKKKDPLSSLESSLQLNSPPHPHSPPPKPPSLLHDKFDQFSLDQEEEEDDDDDDEEDDDEEEVLNHPLTNKGLGKEGEEELEEENEEKNRNRIMDSLRNLYNERKKSKGEKKEEEEGEEMNEDSYESIEDDDDNNIDNIDSIDNVDNIDEDEDDDKDVKLNYRFKKAYSEPYLQKKYNTQELNLGQPTLNSTHDFIKHNWKELKFNKTNFKSLAKQIREGTSGSKPTSRKTFIDQIIKEHTEKPEYYYKNYLTETFGEDRQHLVQNHLNQFRQKLEQKGDEQDQDQDQGQNQGRQKIPRVFTIHGFKFNIDRNGDMSSTETQKAVNYINHRVANRITTVQPFENQYKNLISLQDQDPVEGPEGQKTNQKQKSDYPVATSFIPRAKKVINKNWLASLEIKPPSIEEINDLNEYKEVEIITKSNIKYKDNLMEKPYFTEYVTEDGHAFLQENNPDHPIPSYTSLFLNLMNAKQFLKMQPPKPLDISEIVTFSESMTDCIQKTLNTNAKLSSSQPH